MQNLIGDLRFDTGVARQEREPEIDEMITAWTRRHDKREAMRKLADAGVPAGAVFDTMELTDEPDFVRRGIMQTMDTHPPARSKCRAGRCASADVRRKSSRRRCRTTHQ